MAELVSPPHSHGRYTHYSNKLQDFSLTIPRCYKDVCFNGFFPRTAGLLNSLPVEWFLLTFDLIALSLELIHTFCLINFPISFSSIFLLFLLFLVVPCLVVVIQPCMERNLIKKKTEKQLKIYDLCKAKF